MIQIPGKLKSFLTDVVADVITKQLNKIRNNKKASEQEEHVNKNMFSSDECERELLSRLSALEKNAYNLDFVITQGRALFDKTVEQLINKPNFVVNGNVTINIICFQNVDGEYNLQKITKAIDTRISEIVEDEANSFLEIVEPETNTISEYQDEAGVSKNKTIAEQLTERFIESVNKKRGE